MTRKELAVGGARKGEIWSAVRKKIYENLVKTEELIPSPILLLQI